jgi:hypothetical protein
MTVAAKKEEEIERADPDLLSFYSFLPSVNRFQSKRAASFCPETLIPAAVTAAAVSSRNSSVHPFRSE